MALSKKQRELLREMFGGKCAYCGCDLPEKGWHADHMDPVIRCTIDSDRQMLVPENDSASNLVPACHKCNLHKHANDVENYRRIINDGRREFLASGKGKALIRMGLVSVSLEPVEFWFEKYVKL